MQHPIPTFWSRFFDAINTTINNTPLEDFIEDFERNNIETKAEIKAHIKNSYQKTKALISTKYHNGWQMRWKFLLDTYTLPSIVDYLNCYSSAPIRKSTLKSSQSTICDSYHHNPKYVPPKKKQRRHSPNNSNTNTNVSKSIPHIALPLRSCTTEPSIVDSDSTEKCQTKDKKQRQRKEDEARAKELEVERKRLDSLERKRQRQRMKDELAAKQKEDEARAKELEDERKRLKMERERQRMMDELAAKQKEDEARAKELEDERKRLKMERERQRMMDELAAKQKEDEARAKELEDERKRLHELAAKQKEPYEERARKFQEEQELAAFAEKLLVNSLVIKQSMFQRWKPRNSILYSHAIHQQRFTPKFYTDTKPIHSPIHSHQSFTPTPNQSIHQYIHQLIMIHQLIEYYKRILMVLCARSNTNHTRKWKFTAKNRLERKS
eukprot:196756_1